MRARPIILLVAVVGSLCATAQPPTVILPVENNKRAKELNPPKDDPRPQQDKTIPEVENLIAKREWITAVDRMKKLRKECRGAAMCTEEVDFTDGFLQQQWYFDDGDTTHLSEALKYYEKISRFDQHFVAAKYNSSLIYREMHNTDAAIQQLQQGRSSGMQDADVILGDVCFEAARYSEALYYYRWASYLDPLNKSIHSRMVQAYKYNTSSSKKILDHVSQMRSLGFGDLAINAVGDLINRIYRKHVETDTTLIAFLFWTNLSAERDDINLDQLPSDWDAQAWSELRSVLANPKATDRAMWWRQGARLALLTEDLRGPVILGKVLRTVAHSALDRNDLAEATSILQIAYDVISQRDIYAFLDRPEEIPRIFYDVAGELAMLYTLHPDLPEAKRKFAELEDQLFNGKTNAYLQVTGEAIENFHTTLGLIYATRKKWQGSLYRNGIYQLQNAIDKAPIWRNNGILRMELSKGLVAVDKYEQSIKTLLEAAKTFLNSDDLRMAERALGEYKGMNGPTDVTFNEIKRIIDFRKNIGIMPASQLRSFMSTGSIIEQYTGGKEPKTYFEQLQRFKILSDLASRAGETKEERAELYYSSTAFLASSELTNFVSFKDLSRLSNQVKAIKSHIGFTWRAGDLVSQSIERTWEGQTAKWWSWSDAASRTQRIGVNAKALSAAALTGKLKSSDEGFYKERQVVVDSEGQIYSSDTKYFEKLLASYDKKVHDISKLKTEVGLR